jgi:prevent-host-death family protein
MQHVDLDEIGNRLPDLVNAAVNGEDVFIDANGQEVVQLVPVARLKRRRQFGSAKGLIWMADDFDAPLEDFKDYME